jgi:hypothetical protein
VGQKYYGIKLALFGIINRLVWKRVYSAANFTYI